MRLVRRWATLCATIGLAHHAGAQTASPDETRVRAVVGSYLHGLKFNDVDSLRAAFWPDAKLMWIKRDGTMGQLTQPEWYRTFATSAGQEEKGELHIAALEITDNIAAVKVVETYATSVYVDYLNLLRIGSDWRIVNKVYTSHPRESARVSRTRG
jgi:hypothetical protein